MKRKTMKLPKSNKINLDDLSSEEFNQLADQLTKQTERILSKARNDLNNAWEQYGVRVELNLKLLKPKPAAKKKTTKKKTTTKKKAKKKATKKRTKKKTS